LVAEHRGRLLAVSVVVLVLFVVLVGRLGQVQLVEGADTAVSAAGTNTRTLPVPAVRGRILDRHGVPLVANTTSLTVTMDRRVFTAQPTRARESLTALADVVAPRPLGGDRPGPPVW
jgi:penicillin-binding protein 2